MNHVSPKAKDGFLSALMTCVLAAGGPVLAAPQASLTLSNSGINNCQVNDTAWGLVKSGGLSENVVNWTVQAGKGATTPNFIKVDGYVNIQNTGSGPATIGSILLNLQVKPGKKWITAASDIADSTHGDAATTANICGQASSEGLSSFFESPASGPLEFTDVANNTVFSLVPQPVIPPGQSLQLLFEAAFNNAALGLSEGTPIRAEAIVTFGNAGARGGGGAVCSNVDANGDGLLSPDESKVRSVPSRVLMGVGALQWCNSSPLLRDESSDISATGTVSFSDYQTDIGGGTGSEPVYDSASRFVKVNASPGASGGTISNHANLRGSDSFVTVNGPTDPLTGQPLFSFAFACCVGADWNAFDTQEISAPAAFGPGRHLSYSQGGWGAPPNGNNPASTLANNFSAVYPNGVEVGIPGSDGFSMKFRGAKNVEAYLPAGGPPNPLNADLLDPTKSASGVFGGQVLALQLNVDFNNAGIVQGTGGSIAGLRLANTNTSLDGKTISEILAAANAALGEGPLPADYTYPLLNELIQNLNVAFDGGIPSPWAFDHLVP